MLPGATDLDDTALRFVDGQLGQYQRKPPYFSGSIESGFFEGPGSNVRWKDGRYYDTSGKQLLDITQEPIAPAPPGRTKNEQGFNTYENDPRAWKDGFFWDERAGKYSKSANQQQIPKGALRVGDTSFYSALQKFNSDRRIWDLETGGFYVNVGSHKHPRLGR